MLTCNLYSIALSNISSSGIPMNSIFPNNQAVTVQNWIVPPPSSAPFGNSIFVYTPGVYTMTVKDLNNGCISSTTAVIGDNRIYPVLNAPVAATVNCPTGTVNLNTAVAGSQSNLSYTWSTPAGAITSGNASATLTTNSQGLYALSVTNNSNGCATQVFISVYGCVGISEWTALTDQLAIFPNPVNSQLHFKLASALPPNSKLIVHDARGQFIISKEQGDWKDGLDLGFLEQGVYFLTLQSGMNHKVFKIIKD